MMRPYKGVFPVVPTTFTEAGELASKASDAASIS